MLRRLALLAIAVLGSSLLSHAQPPSPSRSPTPVKIEDFAGQWTGAWDRTYGLRLTVAPLTENRAYMLYEWQERTKDPYLRAPRIASFDGKTLTAGSISITLVDGNRRFADAAGNFARPRTSTLFWSQAPDDFIDASVAMNDKVTIDEPLELTLNELWAYLADRHNLVFLSENQTPEATQRFNSLTFKFRPQKDVPMPQFIRQICEQGNLKYRIANKRLLLSFK